MPTSLGLLAGEDLVRGGIIRIAGSYQGLLAGYQQIHIDGRNGATNTEGEGLGYGAGVQWNATQRFGLRGEYTRLTDADADTWSVAGVMNF